MESTTTLIAIELVEVLLLLFLIQQYLFLSLLLLVLPQDASDSSEIKKLYREYKYNYFLP